MDILILTHKHDWIRLMFNNLLKITEQELEALKARVNDMSDVSSETLAYLAFTKNAVLIISKYIGLTMIFQVIIIAGLVVLLLK